jgi:hypothetical protein
MSNPTVTVHDQAGLDALPPHTMITETHEPKGHDDVWTYEVMDPRDNCGMKLRRIHTDYDQSMRLGPIGSPLGQGYVVFPVVVENPEILDFDFDADAIEIADAELIEEDEFNPRLRLQLADDEVGRNGTVECDYFGFSGSVYLAVLDQSGPGEEIEATVSLTPVEVRHLAQWFTALDEILSADVGK